MKTGSSQACYVILVSRRRNLNVQRAATTKIIHRFWSSKAIILSVNISFIFTVFLLFALYYSVYVNDFVGLTKKTLFVYDFYVMRPLFWLSTITKEANKVLQGGVS